MNGSNNRLQNFLKLAPRQVQIAFFIAHHNNQVRKADILQEFATINDKKQVESLERILYNMQGKRMLKETADGTLYLTNPENYRIIVKWVRGNFLDRWTMLLLPFSVLGCLFSFLEGSVTGTVFGLIIIGMIVLWHIDDYAHTSKGY